MERETTLPYSTLWSFWQPPYAAPLRDFQDTLLFWKTTRPLGALAAAAVPKAPAASNGHNFVVRAPNLSSDHSIGIYSLRRCRWAPHLLHLSKYSLSYAPPKSRDSRASLLGLTLLGAVPRQHPIQNSITSCPHLRLRCSWAF